MISRPQVEPDLYRFRLLNGCGSRFLNLALKEIGGRRGELPFFQIGGDQGLLPNVVKITTGFKTILPGGGTIPKKKDAAHPDEALLMAPGERADVIVDFRDLDSGTIVRLINTGPDTPFGGFPIDPEDLAKEDTTRHVMEFHVVKDPFTDPEKLQLSLPDEPHPETQLTRDLALLEVDSDFVCVDNNVQVDGGPDNCPVGSVPFGPQAAVLGVDGSLGVDGASVKLWEDPLTQNPALDATEVWELWNLSEDAHPIHLHLVKFLVVDRQTIDIITGALDGAPRDPEATERGFKDTVIAYPNEVTRIKATFDIPGLFVWHCHVLEHEDNEMMLPLCVGPPTAPGCHVAA